jgi:hypothetical protein
MDTRLPFFLALAIFLGPVQNIQAQEKTDKDTKTVGGYRVELHVLPPEPFYTDEDIAAEHVK